VNFGKAIIQVLELQWLMKRHVSGQSDIKQCKNQAHSLSSLSSYTCLKALQVFAIELVTFTVDFVPLAVEFGAFAVEFIGFAVEFIALALQFIALAIELGAFALELVEFALKFVMAVMTPKN